MKTLFSLLVLAWFAVMARAANPSFESLNTNFFQVTGTGTGSIRIKTNAFTWLNAGGTQVWTNSAGVIQPTTTNLAAVIRFSHADGDANLQIGSNDVTKATLYSFNDGASFQSGLGLRASLTTSEFTIDWADTFAQIRGVFDGDVMFNIEPTAADGTTPYTWDTSVKHTSGNLLEVKNAGLLPWAAAFHGGMQVGSNTLAYFGANDPGEVFVSYSDISNGDPNKNYQIFGVTDGVIESNYEISITTNRALISVASTGTSGFDGVSLNSQPGANKILIGVNNTDRVQWFPAAGATTLPHFTDTSVLHTSNGLFENRNLGLVHFRTETTNGVSTPRIAALSATSRPWQFGSVVSNATITASVTNYVELAVNGSLYKLVIANP